MNDVELIRWALQHPHAFKAEKRSCLRCDALEALARLSAVESERDSLRDQRDQALTDLRVVQDAGHEIFERLGNQERRAEAAESRAEALSEALRKIAEYPHPGSSLAAMFQSIARAALAAVPEPAE
jgi:DNA repair ATPase RecN